MIDFILLLILTSLWCFGVWNAFDEDMVFGGLRKYIDNWPGWIRKPLVDCPPCLASVHGFAAYAIFHEIDLMVIPFIVCLSGLNWLLLNLTE